MTNYTKENCWNLISIWDKPFSYVTSVKLPESEVDSYIEAVTDIDGWDIDVSFAYTPLDPELYLTLRKEAYEQ